MAESNSIFAEWGPRYSALGFWPRPVSPKSKACHAKAWQKPNPEISEAIRDRWLNLPEHGIGLLMGSPFPDGTKLGAFDIDRDEYSRLGITMFENPPCCRFGKKGLVIFVRVRGIPRNLEFRVKGDEENHWGKVAECLFIKKLCVIPPTLHPETGASYRWIGTPLHEMDFNLLPIVEM